MSLRHGESAKRSLFLSNPEMTKRPGETVHLMAGKRAGRRESQRASEHDYQLQEKMFMRR